MGKIKDNFIRRYLPMWVKETVFADNCKLQKKNERLKKEIDNLLAYICGMEYVLKKRTDDFCSYGERKDNERKAD